jgi:hypothetical protein
VREVQTMTNLLSAFQPAIDALEKEFEDLERNAYAILQSINLLRSKAGLPPRPGSGNFGHQAGPGKGGGHSSPKLKIHSDSFTGKKLGAAVREYLTMRKASGGDAPATSREIFDALKEGGFSSGAKDEATALVVLRTLLRKDTKGFAKLANGKYGIRSWYPNLKAPKDSSKTVAADEEGADVDLEAGADEETNVSDTAATELEDKAVA